MSKSQMITVKDSHQFFRLSIFIFLVLSLVFLLKTDIALAQEKSVNQSAFNSQIYLQNVLHWVDSLGIIGVVAFIFIYIIATILFLPASILTLGAGIIFGVFWGSIYVFIGATLGATSAFLVGRYLARSWITHKIVSNSRFVAIDKAVSREGLKIVLLTRLSPIFPFNLLNYAFGITGVSVKDYLLGSVGMIPGTVMYVYLGSLAGNLAIISTETSTNNSALQWGMRILGFLATVTVTIYISYIARKALEDEIL